MFIQREPQDTAKIRRLAIAATLIVAGITCLVLAFRPAGGTMLIRPGVTLVVLTTTRVMSNGVVCLLLMT